MKILVSNDDGINAKGIEAITDALKEIGEVTVVAPLTEQSAVGHAITMKSPLRITEIYKNNSFFGYAVSGTPADCVKMGIRNILHSTPDIVVSGINHGGNAAINIIYSGTVSAAREAAIMGIPSIAISVASHKPQYFKAAEEIVKKLVKFLLNNKFPATPCLNVNVPNIPPEEIKGVKFTTQGNSTWDDIYEERKDPYGNSYFWLTGSLTPDSKDINSDEYNLVNNFISVTPIHFDLTDYNTLEIIKNLNPEIEL